MGSKFRETWGRFLTNPKLNGWGFIVGVLGIALAVYSDRTNRSEPLLTGRVSSKMAIVVSDEPIQDLKIYVGDKQVKGPITAAQIAVWNAGRRPIRGGQSDDVLEPIVVALKSKAPIISARISKVTRDLSRIELDESRLANGEVGLKFKVLEQGDGMVLQVIYLGDDTASFVGRGTVLGQGSFELAQPNRTFGGKPMDPPPMAIRLFMIIGSPFFFGLIALSIGILFVDKVRSISQSIKSQSASMATLTKPVLASIFYLVMLAVVLVFAALIFMAFLPGQEPPFAFS